MDQQLVHVSSQVIIGPPKSATSRRTIALDKTTVRPADPVMRFYARLLGWRIFNEGKRGAALAPSEDDAGYNLAFETEESYARPVWPTEEGKALMSMHLDIEVDDLEGAVAYAIGVGVEMAAYQPQQTVRVILDPGHPFCLYLDTDGSA